ncbi:MAG: hypothetical protein AAF614_41430 [Chloroflexota bacterium]
MDIAQLFRNVTGIVCADAYDTAWVALVPDASHSSKPQFPQALETLRTMQLTDGGWGSPQIYHASERTLCTLAALCALLHWKQQKTDMTRVAQGIEALYKYALDLDNDSYELVGYELLLPRLIQLLEPFNLDLPYHAWQEVLKIGELKRKLIGELKIDVEHPRTWWFSAEMLTETELGQFDDSFLNEHGAIVTAVAPTAAYLRACRLQGQDSPRAARFLEKVLILGNGGAAFAWPMEHFETLWMLDQFKRVDFPANNKTIHRITEQLSYAWNQPPFGFSSSSAFNVADGDDTTIGYDVLRWAGYRPCPKPLLAFWETNHFRTYLDERTKSVTVNLHALSALKHDLQNIPEFTHYAEQTAGWLQPQLKSSDCCRDKWHYSSVYVASHAIEAIWYWDRPLAEKCLEFLLEAQGPNGGWGAHRVETVEETGHALIGLMAAHRLGLLRDKRPLYHAAHFLDVHGADPAQERLWLGKTLFHSPKIIGAIRLATSYGLEQLDIRIEPYQSKLTAVF